MISGIELLSYPELSREEAERIQDFLSRINIIELTAEVKREAVMIRKSKKLKLPDAIIVATAITLDAILLTNDVGLSKTPGIRCFIPEVVS